MKVRRSEGWAGEGSLARAKLDTDENDFKRSSVGGNGIELGVPALDSATEQSAPTSSIPRGRRRLSLAPGRAPYSKGSLDLGHQRDVGFVSSAHVTKLSLRASPSLSGGVRVRKGTFVPSGDAVWIASPQRVPEPGPCPGMSMTT